jgi:hypothetical protein
VLLSSVYGSPNSNSFLPSCSDSSAISSSPSDLQPRLLCAFPFHFSIKVAQTHENNSPKLNRFRTLPSSVSSKFFPCHSYENCRGVPKQFPFRNRQHAGSRKLFPVSQLRTPLQARISQLHCIHTLPHSSPRTPGVWVARPTHALRIARRTILRHFFRKQNRKAQPIHQRSGSTIFTSLLRYIFTSSFRLNPAQEPLSALLSGGANNASQYSNKCSRTPSRCKSPALPCPRFPPVLYRPCESREETL